jgi:histidyl-tRNA synthetase
VLQRARKLLAGHAALEPLNDLATVCDWLPALGVGEFEVVLGTARNLDFYTGMVFEIDTPLAGAVRQLCGGGRYDGLVEEFAGPPTPATGFAFGFDRLVEAFKATGQQVGVNPVDVVVISPPGQRPKAVALAEQLRGAGVRVGVDLSSTSDVKEQESYGQKLQPKYLVLVGAEGLSPDQCKLRLVNSGADRTVPVRDVVREIQK